MTCPSCGSKKVRRDGWSGMFQVIDGKEVQLPSWGCEDCHYAGTKDCFDNKP